MQTMVTPFLSVETDYRREQLTRAWGVAQPARRAHRDSIDGPRRGRARHVTTGPARLAAPAR